MCDACLAKMKANHERRIAFRKKNGLCRRCTDPVVPGYGECQKHLADQKVRRKKRISKGGCAYCFRPAVDKKTICIVCSEKRKDVAKLKNINGICVSLGCINIAVQGKKSCKKCSEKRSARMKRLKMIVINHYGQKCNCPCGCGVTNIKHLTIDHKNNDGAEQRRNRGMHGGHANYRYIIKDGFPDDLQVLCFNCNCAKEFSGGCV